MIEAFTGCYLHPMMDHQSMRADLLQFFLNEVICSLKIWTVLS